MAKVEETIAVVPKKSAVIVPWLLVAALLALFGYGYWVGHKPMAEQLQKKEVELAKATGDVQRAAAETNTAKAELDKAQGELKMVRSELAHSAQQQDADQKLLEELKKQVGGADVSGQNGQITVTMVDKVLFKSGEADLSPEGAELLKRLGGVLKGNDKLVEVAGHADNEPVKSEIRELYPTNWELSTARATNVVRFLQDGVGLNPRRMKATGYSSYRPVASNKSANGRAKNRRIEILLLPNKFKTVKGDFADEIAAAAPSGKTVVAQATDKSRLAALRAKQAPSAAKKRAR
jgi:chemotaxis protein MotB